LSAELLSTVSSFKAENTKGTTKLGVAERGQRNKQKKLLPPTIVWQIRPDGHKEPKRLSLSSWMKWLLKEEGRRRERIELHNWCAVAGGLMRARCNLSVNQQQPHKQTQTQI
jgi:hypothetical protein